MSAGGTPSAARAPHEALILAAGYGSRLRSLGTSKPLTSIAGITLLELGIRQAIAAGVERVVVVTGHEAEQVEAVLPALAQKCSVTVEARRVADWSRPNGWSVLAGAEAIEADYLLMMADHIFSRPILTELVRQGGASRGVTLAIDRRVDSPLVDPDDATWVRTSRSGRIRAIGKSLTDFDAVDCGAFLATRELAAAISEAISSGLPGTLSDGMQWLADRGRAQTMDIGDAWWIDVDDAQMHRLAEAMVETELPEVYRPVHGRAGFRDLLVGAPASQFM
nr:NTP transferase domain-containing protein [Novosphingobium guangzhouense]